VNDIEEIKNKTHDKRGFYFLWRRRADLRPLSAIQAFVDIPVILTITADTTFHCTDHHHYKKQNPARGGVLFFFGGDGRI
jgi:hypothetical protein